MGDLAFTEVSGNPRGGGPSPRGRKDGLLETVALLNCRVDYSCLTQRGSRDAQVPNRQPGNNPDDRRPIPGCAVRPEPRASLYTGRLPTTGHRVKPTRAERVERQPISTYRSRSPCRRERGHVALESEDRTKRHIEP